MIKIGTLFSGIGSPEKALEYLGVDHEIVFACDSGGIEIDVDYEAELKHVKNMRTSAEQQTYVEELYKKNSRKTNFVEKTYLENYEIEKEQYFYDVKLLDGQKFQNQVDILVGGSPCQSFSAIGNRHGLEDARGTLFYDYARIVMEIQPKVFIYENVHGLLTHDKGKTWEVIQEIFSSLGYHYKFQVLDARDYGIPQGRRRLFVVGFKEEENLKNFKFPNPIELQYTMQDFLIENSAEGCVERVNGKIKVRKQCGLIDEKLFLSEKLKAYVLSPGTKNFYHPNAKTDLPIARALLASMGNSHRASVNNYVTTEGKLRALAPRETARLMGYADDFNIVVSKAQAYKQFGNSIVVDVMMALLKEVLGVMNESS